MGTPPPKKREKEKQSLSFDDVLHEQVNENILVEECSGTYPSDVISRSQPLLSEQGATSDSCCKHHQND